MQLKVLAIGGGGGGGSGGGGGGAGGYQYDAAFVVTAQAYTVTVGDGGAGSAGGTGSTGGNSVFSTITANGGGYGSGVNGAEGGNGGSGGGAGINASPNTGGTGSQGGNGGTFLATNKSGGGGGASANGANADGSGSGNGGAGTSNSITGSAVTYAGGGGGASYAAASGTSGTGGAGGGGNGGTDAIGTAGTANLGGGGGGGAGGYASGAGGVGVVIVSYVTADFGVCTSSGVENTNYTKATDGANTVFRWITAGSHTFTVVGNATAPTVTTQAASLISYNSATGNGNVTSDGGATVTERGIVWGTSTNPTTAGNKATSAGTTGAFTASMTSLTAGTHYYSRAYAINSVGTSYGTNAEFDTLAAPTATTQAVSSISYTTATGNGNITSDGGVAISERGIVWNTSTNPTTSNNKATASGTTGAFTASLTGLSQGTHYYTRAYAINAAGTSYGTNAEFDSLTAPTMPARSGEAERLYFSLKLGGTNTGKPLNQIKREYFAKFIGAGNARTPFDELELQWMLKVLANAGITPAPRFYRGDLWKQMVSAVGKTPTRYVAQNKLIFFSNLI